MYAKENMHTSPTDTRFILPLSATLQLLDVILSERFQSWISRNVCLDPSVHVGGRKGTQCLDLAHLSHLAVEKGLDDNSRISIASSDVRRFFDSLPVLRLAIWLLARRHGCQHC